MAKVGRRRLAREVVRLLKEQPGRRADIVRQVAAYLIANKQLRQVDLFTKDLADELQATDAHLCAEVETAFTLNKESHGAVVEMLKKSTGAKSVELNEKINPDLLGGVVVRTPRQELDASVRRQLKQIAGGIK